MKLKNPNNNDTLVGIFLPEVKHEEFLNECFYSLAMQDKPVDVLVMYDSLSENELELLNSILKEPVIKYKKKNEENPEQIDDITDSAGNSLNYSLEKVCVKNFADVFNIVFQTAIENNYSKISIIEPEDVFSRKWLEVVDVYASENPEVAIFTPIIKHMVGGSFSGFLNEACWAESMAEEAGKYDNNLLLRFNFIVHPLGAVYMLDRLLKEDGVFEKRDEFLFPMKSGIKIFNYYEFFLRTVYNDLKVMNVPRIGYEMRVLRKDKYDPTSAKIPHNLTAMPEHSGGISQDEAQFWAKYATDAYFMEDDEKDIKYEPSSGN